jgi:predicted LPLAT superfamily acyltransferase
MSQHWATMTEAGALAGLRTMVWIHSHLGRFAFSVVLVPVMAYFLVRRSAARQASRDFLRRVKRQYPESLKGNASWWLSFRHFLAFGNAMLDGVIASMQPSDEFDMEADERKLMADLAQSGQGILMIGSHFGNLAYSRSIAQNNKSLVVNILIYEQHAANFTTLLADASPASRLNLIQVTDLDLELALRLKEKVQNGEWVVIAGDRVPVKTGDNICSATFFGETAKFPIGPYVLAKLLKCPVYLLHCFRSQGQYQLSLELFQNEITTSRRNRQRSYDIEVQKFATALERQVIREPLQWFNFYDFWDD